MHHQSSDVHAARRHEVGDARIAVAHSAHELEGAHRGIHGGAADFRLLVHGSPPCRRDAALSHCPAGGKLGSIETSRGCGAASVEVASPTSMTLPLPSTEAGPRGARIKPAVCAPRPPQTANVCDEDGRCKGACRTLSRHRLRGTVGGNPKGLISTRSGPCLWCKN